MLSYLIFGITYAFAAAVQPGPLQTYIICQTLSRGWKQTLPAAFAPLISDGPIIVVMLLLLKQMPSGFEHTLQIGGGIFLLYLAFHAYKTWKHHNAQNFSSGQSNSQTLWKATLVNLLNPNPYLGWSLVMGPLFLKGWHETPVNGIVLIAGFYTTIIISIMGIIFLFAGARHLGPKVTRMSVGLSSVALACFGLYELWLGSGIFW